MSHGTVVENERFCGTRRYVYGVEWWAVGTKT